MELALLNMLQKYKMNSRIVWLYNLKKFGSGGIRTHASEETGA